MREVVVPSKNRPLGGAARSVVKHVIVIIIIIINVFQPSEMLSRPYARREGRSTSYQVFPKKRPSRPWRHDRWRVPQIPYGRSGTRRDSTCDPREPPEWEGPRTGHDPERGAETDARGDRPRPS